ncbi:8963_t:CDS:1, partial [Funneliformis caledonium]
MDDYFNVQEEFNQEDPDHEYLNNFNDDEWEDMNPNDDNSAPV